MMTKTLQNKPRFGCLFIGYTVIYSKKQLIPRNWENISRYKYHIINLFIETWLLVLMQTIL